MFSPHSGDSPKRPQPPPLPRTNLGSSSPRRWKAKTDEAKAPDSSWGTRPPCSEGSFNTLFSRARNASLSDLDNQMVSEKKRIRRGSGAAAPIYHRAESDSLSLH